MRRIATSRAGSALMIPAMPHMPGSESVTGGSHAAICCQTSVDRSFQHLLVPGRAAVYEIGFDHLSVPLPEPAPQINVCMNCTDCMGERADVIQLDDESRFAAR